MQHTPWTVRSADWPVTSKTTLASIAKDIGKLSNCFESLTSVRINKRHSAAEKQQNCRSTGRRGQNTTECLNLRHPHFLLAGVCPMASHGRSTLSVIIAVALASFALIAAQVSRASAQAQAAKANAQDAAASQSKEAQAAREAEAKEAAAQA